MYSLEWPRVYSAPKATALFKSTPEDFQVDELVSGQFSGEGEHILLKIEKRGLNTEEVVKSLGRLINKPTKLISYAGLKDRQALSTQWLSVHAPGETIAGIETLAEPGWKVIESARHNKKLRPGYLSGNRFTIRLRDLTHIDDLQQRIEQVKQSGVPNYFGEQRFGRDGGNLIKAETMLVQKRKVKDRFLKGMYCSAARSWLFNLILAQRVTQECWNTAVSGDVMQLSGSNSIFCPTEINSEIAQRIYEKDISPASPLSGRGKNPASDRALEIINTIYSQWQPWLDGLESQGLELAWRANILHAEDLQYTLNEQALELSFILPAGTYATTLLRELVSY
ncbi:MAG: tRNA pseudouridine(13) synthase TruD [Legionella sp.]|jgi:tRNA pseudouridine13 synthase